MWCPKCGAEYREGIDVCMDCGEKLTEKQPEKTVDLCTYMNEKDAKHLLTFFINQGITTATLKNNKNDTYTIFVTESEADNANSLFKALMDGLEEDEILEKIKTFEKQWKRERRREKLRKQGRKFAEDYARNRKKDKEKKKEEETMSDNKKEYEDEMDVDDIKDIEEDESLEIDDNESEENMDSYDWDNESEEDDEDEDYGYNFEYEDDGRTIEDILKEFDIDKEVKTATDANKNVVYVYEEVEKEEDNKESNDSEDDVNDDSQDESEDDEEVSKDTTDADNFEVADDENDEEDEKDNPRSLLYASKGDYVTMEEQYRDQQFSGITFIIFGILGGIYLTLTKLNVIPISYALPVFIIIACIFGGFLILGITSVLKAGKIKVHIPEEEKLTNAINKWLDDNLTTEILDSWYDPHVSPAENDLSLMAHIRVVLVIKYENLDVDYLERIAEDYYESLEYETNVPSQYVEPEYDDVNESASDDKSDDKYDDKYDEDVDEDSFENTDEDTTNEHDEDADNKEVRKEAKDGTSSESEEDTDKNIKGNKENNRTNNKNRKGKKKKNKKK